MLEEGRLLQERYRIVRKLDEGGMGEVYLAHHVKLDAPVAIKTLLLGDDSSGQKERQEQFEMEGRLLASLSHSSLARVTDFFEEGSTGFLLMECIDGSTIEDVVGTRGPMGESAALAWASEILDALAYLHGRTPPHCA